MVIRKYINGSVYNGRISYEYGYYYSQKQIHKGETITHGGVIFKVEPGDQCIITFSGDTHADSTYVTYYTYGCGSKPTASSPETSIALSVTKKYYSSDGVTQYTFTVPDGVHYICQSTYNSRASGTNPVTGWIRVIYILKKQKDWQKVDFKIKDSLREMNGEKYIGINISGTKTAFRDQCCSINYRISLSSRQNIIIKVKGDQTNNNNFYVKTATDTNVGSSVTLTAATVTKSYDSVKDETTFAFTVASSVKAVWFGWQGTDAPSLYSTYCPKAYFSYDTVAWQSSSGNYEDGTWLPSSIS